MTTQTPLVPPTPSDTPPSRRGAALGVSIATIVVGAVVLLGTVAGTTASAVAQIADTRSGSSAGSVAAAGLTDLDVEVAGGSLTIAYGNEPDASLDVDGSRAGAWTFERRGDTLRVVSPRGSFAGWDRGSSATLTLPRSLQDTALDARVEVAGGMLDLDADLRELTVNLTGGAVEVSGRADALDVTVAGGAATADVTGVGTASFEVAGGELNAELAGRTPTRTTVTVTAGSADITLPDDEYRVSTDGGLGSIDNSLRTSASATAVVEVEAALGQVSLSS